MSRWERHIFDTLPLPISKGEVNDHSVVFLSGKNPNVLTSNLPETVWNVGGRYPWSAWNGGNKAIHIVSDSANDTYPVVLSGLDQDYNQVTYTITLNGTTQVTTPVMFHRLNNAIYLDGPNSNTGTITFRITDGAGAIVAKIDPQIGNTSMSIYTVPAGYTAFSYWGDFSVNKNEGAQLNAMWRFYGTSFICVFATEVYEQHIYTAPPIPGAIPEKTDIDNLVRFATTNGTRVYSNQQLLLVKNNALHI